MEPEVVTQKFVQQFPGLMTDVDEGDIPWGAATVQTNMQSLVPGKLNTRRGWGRSSDYMSATPTANDLISIYSYPRPDGDYCVTADAGGAVKARRGGAATTIASSRAGDVLWSWARDRRGALLGINGRERGLYWDASTALVDKLGVDAPTTKPTVTITASEGNATAGDYQFYYRYVAKPDEDKTFSNLSPVETKTAIADDKFTWSAVLGSSQLRVTKIQLWRTTSGGDNVLYLVAELDTAGIVASLDDGPLADMKVIWSEKHGLAVDAAFDLDDTTSDDGNYTVKTVIDEYSVEVNSHVWSTDQSTGTTTSTGFVDTFSDQDLQDAALADQTTKLLITLSNGDPNANRFTPPPTNKHCVAKFQDRMFYLGDVVNAEGQINTTDGVATVTFTDAVVDATWIGSYIHIPGIYEPFLVETVTDTTHLTVYPLPSATSSYTSYAIRSPETERNIIYYSEPDEPESVPVVNQLTVQEQTDDEDEIVGAHAFGAFLYILKERHIYTLSFARQPRIDAQSRLLVHRGALNKRCWSVFEGSAYIMDQSGMYAMDMGGKIDPIGLPLQNYFRRKLIDFSKSKWFFTHVDYSEAVARFYVMLAGDTGTKPYRAFCYSIRTGAWWMETYPLALGGAAMMWSGEPVSLGAGQMDLVVDMSAQEAEMVATETRGTLTSATATTLTDTGASFAATLVGSTIAILDGAGRGQVKTITKVTSSTVLDIDQDTGTLQFDQPDFSPVPAAGDAYLIGGMPWTYRTKDNRYHTGQEWNKRAVIVEFEPTTKAYQTLVSRYLNESLSPVANRFNYAPGDNTNLTRSDTFAVVEMKRTASSHGENTGRGEVSTGGRNEGRVQDVWKVAVELSGIKGEEEVAIGSVSITGGQ